MTENIYQEFISCQKDFGYFITNYIKIVHSVQGLVPMTFYDFQKRLVKAFDEHRFVILSKFRSSGMTTISVLYGLWQAMFNSKKFFFVTKTEGEAKHLARLVDRAIHFFPESFRPPLTVNTVTHKVFTTTGGELRFGTIGQGRILPFTHVVIDEAAFIPDMEEKWKILFTCLSTGGSAFVLSTTNGIGNWFADTYIDAKEGKNRFHVFEADYWEHPELNNDEAIKNMKSSLGEKGFLQEILRTFVIEENPKHKDYDFSKLTNDEMAHRLNKLSCMKKITPEDQVLLFEAAVRFKTGKTV